MSNQRNHKATVSDEPIARLKELRFVWDPLAEAWEAMFARLVAYKDVHGDCNVPRGYEPEQLANWVNTQRLLKRRGEPRLTDERIARLNELGFDWG